MNNDQNKKHWNDTNIAYSDVWKSRAKQAMHAKEIGFINRYLHERRPATILDIGIGTGRILKNMIENSLESAQIFGIDVAENMVTTSSRKFEQEKKVLYLRVCDLVTDELPFQENFDFVTAIRVLKYNKNWQAILEKVHEKLNQNGIFIFTMLNNNSLNRFSKYPIPIYKTTKSELAHILEEKGYKLLEMTTFTRIPDIFYDISSNRLYVTLLLATENALAILLGKTLFGRIFFIACTKK